MNNPVIVNTPFIIDLNEISPNDFVDYYLRNKESFENDILKQGAIKFKGIDIDSLETFQHIVDSISQKFLNYIDGNSPRTKLTDHVYTSTEYDQTQKITMHNELSYSAKWYNKLFFSCLQVPETGGETLLLTAEKYLMQCRKR